MSGGSHTSERDASTRVLPWGEPVEGDTIQIADGKDARGVEESIQQQQSVLTDDKTRIWVGRARDHSIDSTIVVKLYVDACKSVVEKSMLHCLLIPHTVFMHVPM